MKSIDPTEQAGLGKAAPVLILGSVLLLLAGGLLVYPYTSSRLAISPTMLTPTPQSSNSITAPPVATSAPHTDAPTPTPTLSPIPVLVPTPALPIRIPRASGGWGPATFRIRGYASGDSRKPLYLLLERMTLVDNLIDDAKGLSVLRRHEIVAV